MFCFLMLFGSTCHPEVNHCKCVQICLEPSLSSFLSWWECSHPGGKSVFWWMVFRPSGGLPQTWWVRFYIVAVPLTRFGDQKNKTKQKTLMRAWGVFSFNLSLVRVSMSLYEAFSILNAFYGSFGIGIHKVAFLCKRTEKSTLKKKLSKCTVYVYKLNAYCVYFTGMA